MSDRSREAIVLTERWLTGMRTFPADGWDGAADLIARHDQMVMDLERQLDELMPGWHDHLIEVPARRTRPVSA